MGLPGRILRWGLARTPLRVWSGLLRPGVVSLVYHLVADPPQPHFEHLSTFKSVQQFSSELDWITRRGRFIGCDELADLRHRHARPHSPTFHLSFDDGYSPCFTTLRPMLLARRVPCTFFILTGVLDNAALFYRNLVSLCIDRVLRAGADERAGLVAGVNRALKLELPDEAALTRWLKKVPHDQREHVHAAAAALGVDEQAFLRQRQPYLTSAQVKQLADDGFTLGAHTVTHPQLGQERDPEEVQRQIVESCRRVAELTGRKEVPFAFPFNADGVDRALLARIRAENPVVGLMFNTRGFDDDAPLIVNRIGADAAAVPELLRRNYVDWAMGRL